MNINQILNSLSEEEIKEYKDNAIEMKTYASQNLEEIVIKLENLRRQGKLNYYANFNGTKLFSIDVTMDSAFKECLNCSRSTWLRRIKKWSTEAKTRIEQWKKEAEEKLPSWIEEGKKYVHPEKQDSWEKTCIACAKGSYSGLELEKALEIMKMLEERKTFKEIKEKIRNDGHSGMTYSRTMNIVLNYAKRGPALFKDMNRKYSYNEGKQYIRKIEELNRKLDMGYKYDEAKESLKENKIMDVFISCDYIDELSDEAYSNYLDYYQGTVLVDEQGYFEGVINNDEYVKGKILEDGGISLATFCNFKRPSHYYGINDESKINAEHEVYSIAQGILNIGKVKFRFEDSDKDYIQEIKIQEQIKELKENFDEDIQQICDWFSRNFDSECERSISIIREDLNQRLVNSITNEIQGKTLQLALIKKSQ